jgi:cytochrome c553
MSRFTFLLLGIYLLQGATWAQTPEEHFEKKVRPLLLERCVKCHGPETSRSSLRLDSYEGAIKGGKRGAAVVPNAPAESLLLKVVRRQGDYKMPPDGPLSAREISDLELWIKQGAIYPKSNKIVRGTAEHWSFQPIKKYSVPKVKNSSWVRNPIDAFILSKLETAGIASSKQADKRTLIRRVSFDLTGLPPTLSESALYLEDDSANAYENMVNRYLASPTYGERWGRHWLDVARYADSNGLDENVAHGNAWRYRDYVVESFNKNVPYNQFISEQIAGDLLPFKSDSEKHAHLIATGYLTLGPKVLAEVDKQKMEMDIIDEQIDTMGKTFLGLTLGCARCHDHKFDPILTADYYSLAGVFKSTKTMESLVTIAKWNENPLANEKETAQLKEHTAKVAESKKKADDFLTKI